MRFRHNKILKALALSASMALSPTLLANVATSEVKMRINLPSTTGNSGVYKDKSLFDISDDTTYDFKTSVDIYDSKGRPLKQTYYFIKQTATEWLVVTDVNGVLVDYLASNGVLVQGTTPNSVGEQGTIAGRMVFDDVGRLIAVNAGDNQPGSGTLETAFLGENIVSTNADKSQQISLNFNVSATDLLTKPTHFDYDFTVWEWTTNGSTSEPLVVSVEEITGMVNSTTSLEKMIPVKINNKSNIIFNDPLAFRGVFMKKGEAPRYLGSISTSFTDFNDNDKILAVSGNTLRLVQPIGTNTFISNGARAVAINNNDQIVLQSQANAFNPARLLNLNGTTLDFNNPVVQLEALATTREILDRVYIPGAAAGSVGSVIADTSNPVPIKVLGVSDKGEFRVSIRYKATLTDDSCTSVDLHYEFYTKFDEATDSLKAYSSKLNQTTNLVEEVEIAIPASNVIKIQPEHLIANNGLKHYSSFFSTKDGEVDENGNNIPVATLASKPGQRSNGTINGCAVDFENNTCQVDGASFASVGALNQQCEFGTFNTKLGFGFMAVSQLQEPFPFIMSGMTDTNLENTDVTLNDNALARLETALHPLSSDWKISQFIDMNERSEAVALGALGDGDDVPVLINTSILPGTPFLTAEQEIVRGNPDTYDTMLLDWDNISGAEYYELFELDETTGEFAPLLVNGEDSTENSYVRIEDVPGKYTIAIKACNASGCSFMSEPVTFIADQDQDGDNLLDFEEMEFGSDPTNADSDGDGLNDYLELQNKTNPLVEDTDGDGLTDFYEVNNGLSPTSVDTDLDGLLDGEEVNTYGTTANDPDSDDDGRLDGEEVNGVPMTDPLDDDSDNDHLTDGEEVNGSPATDPNLADTDADGLTDFDEVNAIIPLDPTNNDTDGDMLLDGAEVNVHNSSPVLVDTDEDGLSDYDEVITHATSPINPDTDGDGLTDFQEVDQYYTLPTVADTDGDGLTDGQEIIGVFDEQGNQTALPTGTSATNADTDGDGLNDGYEVSFVSTITGNSLNPLVKDTDGDGLEDAFELQFGLDPTDATDADRLIWVPISVGGITVFIPVVND